MSEFDTILYEEHGGAAGNTLNRPDKLNAFNEQMHRELRAAIDLAESNAAIRALLLTGAGRGFCAGQDLGDRDFDSGERPDLGQTIEAFYNPLVLKLRSLPMPVIAAVNGVAAGAGANIALACDFVLAARSARFIQAFCKIGLCPDSGGTYILPRLIGEGRAKGLAMTGQPVDAETALAWGMIWAVHDDETLRDEAIALATHLAVQPTMALAAIKQAIQDSYGNDLKTQLDTERDIQRRLGRSDDYREGVRAFMEKRKPSFTGN